MLLKSMLKWQYLTLALFVAGMIGVASPGWGGLLVSRSGDAGATQLSRQELEKELVTAALENLGWTREETEIKIAHLSADEIHDLSTALGKVMAGGEEEDDSNALGVALVLVLILAGITGLYLFSQN